ncbi:hypothetical protein TVAG_479870 [Trichomonas vaginalis G3]|uniref:Uncharacterized protein n=1 Tax=Trichomonas vaginalis (strain ATCC PRA-98 / G3) TaxID=412133 RepID=A2F8G3_TRIV3|nr:hypothetical protein TVAG_479870 [Trichomonas vaginalis G3]|eukprot:XP_001311744.1 hypothetical protein [Trichomonas vaginalis G3]
MFLLALSSLSIQASSKDELISKIKDELALIKGEIQQIKETIPNGVQFPLQEIPVPFMHINSQSIENDFKLFDTGFTLKYTNSRPIILPSLTGGKVTSSPPKFGTPRNGPGFIGMPKSIIDHDLDPPSPKRLKALQANAFESKKYFQSLPSGKDTKPVPPPFRVLENSLQYPGKPKVVTPVIKPRAESPLLNHRTSFPYFTYKDGKVVSTFENARSTLPYFTYKDGKVVSFANDLNSVQPSHVQIPLAPRPKPLIDQNAFKKLTDTSRPGVSTPPKTGFIPSDEEVDINRPTYVTQLTRPEKSSEEEISDDQDVGVNARGDLVDPPKISADPYEDDHGDIGINQMFRELGKSKQKFGTLNFHNPQFDGDQKQTIPNSLLRDEISKPPTLGMPRKRASFINGFQPKPFQPLVDPRPRLSNDLNSLFDEKQIKMAKVGLSKPQSNRVFTSDDKIPFQLH